MPPETNDVKQTVEIKAASSEEYAAFISQIELRDVWLVEAMVKNHAGPTTPVSGSLRIHDEPTWCLIEGGFRGVIRYSVRVTSADETPGADIIVSIAVDFDSPAPMTDALFALFGPINLPLNTWPYLREFVSTTFGRMNWLPFALPALKRGTTPSGSDASESESSEVRTMDADDESPVPEKRKARRGPKRKDSQEAASVVGELGRRAVPT